MIRELVYGCKNPSMVKNYVSVFLDSTSSLERIHFLNVHGLVRNC